MIIPYSEIQEILKDCYVNDGKKLRVKHSVYNGEREFAIAQIEMCMGLLSEEPIMISLLCSIYRDFYH